MREVRRHEPALFRCAATRHLPRYATGGADAHAAARRHASFCATGSRPARRRGSSTPATRCRENEVVRGSRRRTSCEVVAARVRSPPAAVRHAPQ